MKPATVSECEALRSWALSVPEGEPTRPASADQIENHLEFLAATLPAKAVDNEAGKKRFAVYVSLLAGCPEDALKFMSREACRTLNWMPTPKQCLDIIASYRRPEPDRAKALRLCQQFTDERFQIWIDSVAHGHHSTDVPDQWLRIAVEQGLMRRLHDETYVTRSRYFGPFKHSVAADNPTSA